MDLIRVPLDKPSQATKLDEKHSLIFFSYWAEATGARGGAKGGGGS